MIFHMRTTLVIDDALFRKLKRLAAQERRTLSEITQEALRLGLSVRERAVRRPRTVRLPSFSMGKPAVDLADRDALYEIMEPR